MKQPAITLPGTSLLTHAAWGLGALFVAAGLIGYSLILAPVLLYVLALFGLRQAYLQRSARVALFSPETQVLLLLLGWALAACAWSANPAHTFGEWKDMALLCLGGFIAWRFSVKPVDIRFITALAAGFIIMSAWLCYAYGPGEMTMRAALTSIGIDSNKLLIQTVNRGTCFLAVLIWPCAFALKRSGKYKLMVLMLLAVGAGLFFNESSSAKLAYVAGGLTWLAASCFPKTASRALTVGVPVLFVAMPALTIALLDSSWAASHSQWLETLSAGRFGFWQNFLSGVHDPIWFGYGLHHSNVLYTGPQVPLHPHHIMLQIWFELGIVGLALVAGLVGWLYHRLRDQPAMQATFTAYLAAAFTAFSLWQSWWLAAAWLVAVLCKRLPEPSAK